MPSSAAKYELSVKPVAERHVPTFERLLDRARALTAASVSWEAGKNVGDIKMFFLPPPEDKGLKWWARVSYHSGRRNLPGFDVLYNMFTKDRFENEKDYSPELTSATFLKTVQWGEVWSLHYVLPAPFAPRTSQVLTVTHLETSTPRTAWVISIPFKVDDEDIALSLFVEAGVRAHFCSVERIREQPDGRVEWLCAKQISYGGYMPNWIAQRIALKRITEVVPRVDKFLDQAPKVRTKPKPRLPPLPPRAASNDADFPGATISSSSTQSVRRHGGSGTASQRDKGKGKQRAKATRFESDTRVRQRAADSVKDNSDKSGSGSSKRTEEGKNSSSGTPPIKAKT